MRIDSKTKTKDVLPLLSEAVFAELLEKVPPMPLERSVYEMTLGEFIDAIGDDYAMRFLKEKNALRAFGMVRQFRDEMGQVCGLISKMSVDTDDDERMAMRGIDFPSPKERMLLDARDWFGLHRLEGDGIVMGATDIPLSEYLIMLKDKSSTAKFERARQRQTERKLKEKPKRHGH